MAVGVVSKSAYAEHRGCSAAYVSKLIRLGKLAAPALMPDGKINVILADQMLGAAEPEDRSLPLQRPDPSAPNYSVERAKREAAEAQLAELKVAQRRGEMFPREVVRSAAESVFGRTLASFMEMWAGLSIELARMTDAGAIAERGQAETRAVMARLHTEFMEDAARRSADGR